jgi:hypothetical protein
MGQIEIAAPVLKIMHFCGDAPPFIPATFIPAIVVPVGLEGEGGGEANPTQANPSQNLRACGPVRKAKP